MKEVSICSMHFFVDEKCPMCRVRVPVDPNRPVEKTHVCVRCGFEFFDVVDNCPKCWWAKAEPAPAPTRPTPPPPMSDPNRPVGPNYPWWFAHVIILVIGVFVLIIWRVSS